MSETCHGCQQGDASPVILAIRPYTIVFSDGDRETHVLYCDECASLAECGWSDAVLLVSEELT